MFISHLHSLTPYYLLLLPRRDLLFEAVANERFQIKQAFDPLCLLNCDKVVRMQKPKKGEVEEW